MFDQHAKTLGHHLAARGADVWRRPGKLLVAPLLAISLAAGCSMRPEPIAEQETLNRAAADRAALQAPQAPLSGPLTLESAMARAMVYNLDNRLALYERALQDAQLNVTRMDMLPRLVANAGYVARDRELVSSSFSTASQRVFADRTISVDRERTLGDLTFSWNVLDFGASYYQSKQQGDRVMVAHERRRRTVNNIFHEVRYAFWQAAAAQRLLPNVQRTLAEVRRAHESSKRLERNRDMPLLDALRYQRTLIELQRQMEAVASDLVIAKSRLAQLMGLPISTPYEIAVGNVENAPVPTIALSAEQLERVALVNRPELREEDYNLRIAQNEGRRAILRMLPGISLTGSWNHDSNSFLTYHNWAEVGLRAAFNLVNLVSAPSVMRLADKQGEVVQVRRLALSMAAIAQVNIALQDYGRAKTQYEQAANSAAVERRIQRLSDVGRAADASSELDRVRNMASALVAELQRDRSYADLQNAFATVFVAAGLDPLPNQAGEVDLEAMTARVAEVQRGWMAGQIAVPELPPVEPQVIPRLPADPLVSDAEAKPVAAAPAAAPVAPAPIPMAAVGAPRAIPAAAETADEEDSGFAPLAFINRLLGNE